MSAGEAGEPAEAVRSPRLSLIKVCQQRQARLAERPGPGGGLETGEASQYFSLTLVGRPAWCSAAANINMQPRLDTKFEVHTDLRQPTILLQPQLAGTDQPGHIIAPHSRQPGDLIM